MAAAILRRNVLVLSLVMVATSCTVPEPEFDAGTRPRQTRNCAALKCSAWSACIESSDAGCFEVVKGLRWLVPPADASVPIDTTRIAFELEVEGNIARVPLRSSRGGSALPYPVDGGRVIGWFDVGPLDAGVFELFAGWPDGPDASVAVRIAPERSIEIVGANPPAHGVNTDTFQPNDPDGPAWRRDDLVPIRPWPGSSVTARHVRPGATVMVVDAGGSGDGGLFLRLQDVEFNAFRDEVELAAIGAFWEAPPQRLTVTRWRWQRVVGGVPRPLQIHQPRPAILRQTTYSPIAGIVVGTRDTETSGTLIQYDTEGVPTSAFAGWDAAVTTPYFADVAFVGGVDGDGGFVYMGTRGFKRIAAPIVLAASLDIKVAAAAADGRLLVSWPPEREVTLVPGCDFDGGRLAQLISGYFVILVASDQGVVCRSAYQQDAGFLALRVRPSSLSGPGGQAYVTSSTGEAWQFINWATTYLPSPDGPQNADYILREDGNIFSATRSGLEVYTGFHSGVGPFTGQLSSSLRLVAPLAASPVLRPRSGGWLLLAVDTTGTLRSFEAPMIREQWTWRPDGGLRLNAPLGFSPSRTRLGSLLLIVENRLLSVISDGDVFSNSYGSWRMEGGSVQGCHEACDYEPAP